MGVQAPRELIKSRRLDRHHEHRHPEHPGRIDDHDVAVRHGFG